MHPIWSIWAGLDYTMKLLWEVESSKGVWIVSYVVGVKKCGSIAVMHLYNYCLVA